MSLLSVRDLRVAFGPTTVLSGVSFDLHAGETLAVLGESGSGKSVTAMAVMGILDSPPARVTGGEIRYRDEDLLAMSERDRRRVRGREIAMVFQDALSALNPVFTVGWQIAETLRVREGLARREALARAVELMELVRIPAARERVHDYPHQFSGGMRQRVSIAMALALNPAVLIADEPTTALDVTVQAQILDLLAELRRERNMALLLITHDLGVVAEVADRIAVMYAGRIVEQADVRSLFRAPAHPYTRALLASAPIVGVPPNLADLPAGCAFQPRCGYARDLCRASAPSTVDVGGGRASACHFAREVLVDAPTR
ncbi:MAG: methionine ABC transporter ATP-binding protein [Actinobacteria bacterium 13_1_20CM_3_71_11]|nr:MAG: methionine ABC transporter ATP-binding protein [Actinobacteria bacterium 13_1_20CM_3_71_11]